MENCFFELEAFINEEFDLDRLKEKTDAEIQQRDHRGFSMLMVAAEGGLKDAVKYLIDFGEDLDYEVNGNTAASLAFANGHHEVVLNLLKANAKFPNNYNQETSSDELKAFVKLSEEMHKKVRDVDEGESEILEDTKKYLRETCNSFPYLRHFYDRRNSSLLKTAIINKMFEIYKVLLSLNIFLGSHESVDDIMDELSSSQQRQLRLINEELSTNIFTDDMMILMRNCKLGPGVTNHSQYIEFIRKGLDFLFKIPLVAIILKVVAARRDFKVIFDFTRESVRFLDPSAEPYTNGIFYTSGKIYVAAKDMLDPSKYIEVYSVMAHELCHFAIFLVYENMAKPYWKKEILIEEDFKRIVRECEVEKIEEKTIDLVFECYPESMHHAELIVRVPQMIVLYLNEQNLLTQMRQTFFRLFDFYEVNVVNEMERQLPCIKKKYGTNKEVKNLKRWIILLVAILIILIPLGILLAFSLYERTYSWNTLTDDEKLQFENAKITFNGANVKFSDLFANDSQIYNELSSEHIKFGLYGDSMALSHVVNYLFKEKIILTYENMTQSLRENFLAQRIIFQDQNVIIGSVTNSSEVLNFLTISQIHDVYDGRLIEISSGTKQISDIFIERYFINEFEEIDLLKHYKNDRVNYDDPEVRNFDEIYEEINQLKIFLLSDRAGEGKSTILRNFALRIKQRVSRNWVQYVDLKEHFEAYKQGEKYDLRIKKNLMDFVTKKLLNLHGFEKVLFVEQFTTSRVVFLWDGIDEIAPNYKDLMLQITSLIKSLTNCSQIISTRPQFSKFFSDNFDIKSYRLIPIGKLERVKLLTKLLNKKLEYKESNFWVEFTKFSNGNLQEFILLKDSNESASQFYEKYKDVFIPLENAENTLNSIENVKELISNPLLIRMISEIVIDENVATKSNLNFYTVYETFVTKKIEEVRKKGEIVGKDLTKSIQSVHIMQAHEAYAIKHIFWNNIDQLSLSSLQVMKSIPKARSVISRFGIVNIDSDGGASFTHQTFAEYMVAQYLIKNFEDFDLKHSFNDSDLKIYLLNSVLYNRRFELVKRFIFEYTKLNNDVPEFYEALQYDFVTLGFALDNFLKKVSTFDNLRNSLKKQVTTDENVNFFKFYRTIKDEIDLEFKQSPEFKSALLNKTSEEDIFLIKKFESKKLENLQNILNAYKSVLSKIEIENLIFDQESKRLRTSLMYAAQGELGPLKIFWIFIDENLDEYDKRRILLLEQRRSYTALHYSMFSKDSNSFHYMKDIYEKTFPKEKVREILLKFRKKFLLLAEDILTKGDYKTGLEVARYIEILFSNINDIFHQKDLRKFIEVLKDEENYDSYSNNL